MVTAFLERWTVAMAVGNGEEGVELAVGSDERKRGRSFESDARSLPSRSFPPALVQCVLCDWPELAGCGQTSPRQSPPPEALQRDSYNNLNNLYKL